MNGSLRLLALRATWVVVGIHLVHSQTDKRPLSYFYSPEQDVPVVLGYSNGVLELLESLLDAVSHASSLRSA